MNFIRFRAPRFLLTVIALLFVVAQSRALDLFPDFSELPSRPGISDPLVMLNGTPVETQSQWIDQRRPELKRLFEHYMYGTMPSAPEHLRFDVERVDHTMFGGKATKKEITIRFSDATNAPVIQLLLVVPNARKLEPSSVQPEPGRGAAAMKLTSHARLGANRGSPVFIGMNFCGNHTLVTNLDVALPAGWVQKNCPGCADHHATDAGRGTQLDIWNIEQSIDRGYAVATFYCGDVEPDMTNSTTGLRAFLASEAAAKQQAAPDCGALAAWAWGMSRAVDYLVTDRDTDPDRIIAVGHSRFGKASLLAAAMDERFAMVIPLQAGTGGSAPSRGNKSSESVKAINTSFPHWFNDEFKEFNGHPDRLPFEQDCLIALVAPRRVLLGAAVQDVWANPTGAFEMLRNADAVYRLLGVRGFGNAQFPPVNQLVGGRLAYFIRPGKHSMTKADWQVFLDYADRELP